MLVYLGGKSVINKSLVSWKVNLLSNRSSQSANGGLRPGVPRLHLKPAVELSNA